MPAAFIKAVSGLICWWWWFLFRVFFVLFCFCNLDVSNPKMATKVFIISKVHGLLCGINVCTQASTKFTIRFITDSIKIKMKRN